MDIVNIIYRYCLSILGCHTVTKIFLFTLKFLSSFYSSCRLVTLQCAYDPVTIYLRQQTTYYFVSLTSETVRKLRTIFCIRVCLFRVMIPDLVASPFTSSYQVCPKDRSLPVYALVTSQ